MIGLDTNVLVRYLMKDDASQFRQASALIASFSQDEPGFITLIVLVELVWVLQSCYQMNRSDLVKFLKLLLGAKEILVQEAAWVWRALRRFEAATADFTDCLIACCAQAAGCQYTVTFDRQAAKTAGMISILQFRKGKK